MARYQYKYRKPQRRHFRVKWLLWTLLFVAALAYPFMEATLLTVDEHTVTVKNLPANLKNLKIVILPAISISAYGFRSRASTS